MRSRALSSNNQQTNSSFSSTPSSNHSNVVTIPRSHMPSRKIKSIYEIVNDTYGVLSAKSQPQSTSSAGSFNSRNKPQQGNRVMLNQTVNGGDSFSFESQRPQYSESYSNRSNQPITEHYFSEQSKTSSTNAQPGLNSIKQYQSSTPNSTMSSSSSFEAAFISSNIALKKPQISISQKRTAFPQSEDDLKENSMGSSNFNRDPVQISQKTPLFKLSTQYQQSQQGQLEKQEGFQMLDLKQQLEQIQLPQQVAQENPSNSLNYQQFKPNSFQLFSNSNYHKREQIATPIPCENQQTLDESFNNNLQQVQQQYKLPLQQKRSPSAEDSYNKKMNYGSNGGITPLFAGDEEELIEFGGQAPVNSDLAMIHQLNKQNRAEFENNSDNNNEIIRRMRETIHSLQSKDASYRLEISKLKKHNQQLKQIITDNNSKQGPILDQMRKDGEYIRQLDDQLTVYKQKISQMQKTLVDQGKLQEKLTEYEKKGTELEEENMQLRITIESILMIQQEQIDKIEQQQQNGSNINHSEEQSDVQGLQYNSEEQSIDQNSQNNNPGNHDYFYLPNEEDIIREQVEEEERSEKSIDERMYTSNHIQRDIYGNDLSQQQQNQGQHISSEQPSTKKVTVSLQTLLQASRGGGEQNRERDRFKLISKQNDRNQESYDQEMLEISRQVGQNQSELVFQKKQMMQEDEEDDKSKEEDYVNYDDNLDVKRVEAIQLFQQARALLLR